jgi:hypothetical protein
MRRLDIISLAVAVGVGAAAHGVLRYYRGRDHPLSDSFIGGAYAVLAMCALLALMTLF